MSEINTTVEFWKGALTGLVALVAIATIGASTIGASQQNSINRQINLLSSKINGSCEGAQTKVSPELEDVVVKLSGDEVRWRKESDSGFQNWTKVRCEFEGGEKIISNADFAIQSPRLVFKPSKEGGYQLATPGREYERSN